MACLEFRYQYYREHIEQIKEKIRTLTELFTNAENVWNSILLEYIDKLYESLPNRIRSVITNKG